MTARRLKITRENWGGRVRHFDVDDAVAWKFTTAEPTETERHMGRVFGKFAEMLYDAGRIAPDEMARFLRPEFLVEELEDEE